MKDNGMGLKMFATGIRQPWQMAFAPGSKNPFVSDLGQDKPASLNPPDFVLSVRQGDDYGFPQCTQVVAGKCNGDAKPFKGFAAPTVGLGAQGSTPYVGELTGQIFSIQP
jgi:glucose/arabinose dehydrogenase